MILREKHMERSRTVTDHEIIGLFNTRDENALQVTQEKYGAYCGAVARNILNDDGDAEECFNDALLRAWNAIPPAEPRNLRVYLARIVRNAAVNMYQRRGAAKRGGGQMDIAFDEIEEFTGPDSVESAVDSRVFTDVMNRFLTSLPKQQRVIFVKRYFYFDGCAEIAADLAVSESMVKGVLFRLRGKLKTILEKEGVL